jgi:GMP synthase (glutamine-hydrolysing)
MKLHWLQHVPFEGLGYIENWAKMRGAELSCTRLFLDEELPDRIGPMGIHDHGEYPWLAAEKEFIGRAIKANKTVLGICLGAQLMADVLGAQVYPGPQKEIGWFPVRRSERAPALIPEELTVFHWHGDTFDIPAGTVKLATSNPGINQGFVYNDRAVGLQFHMETTSESMEALIENCADELVEAPYIQSAARMRAAQSNIEKVNAAMMHLLDKLYL